MNTNPDVSLSMPRIGSDTAAGGVGTHHAVSQSDNINRHNNSHGMTNTNSTSGQYVNNTNSGMTNSGMTNQGMTNQGMNDGRTRTTRSMAAKENAMMSADKHHMGGSYSYDMPAENADLRTANAAPMAATHRTHHTHTTGSNVQSGGGYTDSTVVQNSSSATPMDAQRFDSSTTGHHHHHGNSAARSGERVGIAGSELQGMGNTTGTFNTASTSNISSGLSARDLGLEEREAFQYSNSETTRGNATAAESLERLQNSAGRRM